MLLQIISSLLLFASIAAAETVKYDPTWSSIDKRPLPAWYDEAKFGIFMHWGVYSVPSYGSEWFWYNWRTGDPGTVQFMKHNFKPNFSYADFGPMFTAEFFDANRFAELIKSSGARYFVLTSKHHEGFTNWPSKYSWNWNSVDVGPNRDIVGELANALRFAAPQVHFGLYYSLFQWYHPLYELDKNNSYKTQEYNKIVMWPQIKELIETYKPEVLWSDGDWEAPDTYWNSTTFLAWLYNESPVRDTVVTNDRWGSGIACHHGGYYTCSDRYSPGVLQPHKWENCMTVDSASWGFRRTMNIEDVLSIEQLISTLASTVSCGGNLLMNVGPTHDGRIVPVFEERLRQMGKWLSTNGEAIYSSKPWIHQNDTITPNIWFTSQLSQVEASQRPGRLYNPQMKKATTVYAIVLNWPSNNLLVLGTPKATRDTVITLLGYAGPALRYKQSPTGLQIDFSTVDWLKLPNLWAWVLKMENLASDSRVPDVYRPIIGEKQSAPNKGFKIVGQHKTAAEQLIKEHKPINDL